MGKRWSCLIALVLVSGTIVDAYGDEKDSLGLRVQPGAFFVQNVVLGRLYDVYEESGLHLTIFNRSERERTYVLSTHLPSDVGANKWVRGYSEVPDLSWFWFDRYEVSVGPREFGRVKMFFEIPQEERYHNQHWVFALGIRGKAESGEILQLAAFPRVQIETESKEVADRLSHGSFGLEPSAVLLKEQGLGTRAEAILKPYNNDVDEKSYRLSPRTFSQQKRRLPLISNTPGYEWIPETGWIALSDDRISIEPGSKTAVSVSVSIPANKHNRAKRWESIILMESEDGRSRFARLLIQTEQ